MATPAAKRLEGKVALITGGASGIGESTARLFVQHGARVLIADIQDELGSSLCQKLGTEETISYVHCDVTCDSDVKQAVDLAVTKYGKLDIMFNNAGVCSKFGDQGIVGTDNEDFKRIMDVNLFGAFLGAKHAARVMIPARKGCILFTSSTASLISIGLPHAYVVSKHAVVGLAKNLCLELGEFGIRVNCVAPYAMPTNLLQKSAGMVEKEKLEEMISSSAVLKEAVLKPEDIAEAALYLASDESKYVSGINLPVDGGYRVANSSLGTAINTLLS